MVSPTLDASVVATAHQYGCSCMPGCFTPTEINEAMKLGVDFVKLFPASAVGPSYVKSILAPLPNVHLVPVRGVEADDARAYLDAGAAALGVGGSICNDQILRDEGLEGVAARTASFIETLRGKGVSSAAPQQPASVVIASGDPFDVIDPSKGQASARPSASSTPEDVHEPQPRQPRHSGNGAGLVRRNEQKSLPMRPRC